MLGSSSEEKHETMPQQPLTQQQVLQHLQTLQNRMGAMQAWAKGLSDQAQQDKLKIQTLEKQLEAAKTLQWAKQDDGVLSRGEAISSKASSLSGKVSTPRLDQIRRAREERETALRIQFTHSAEHQQDDIAPTSELSQQLEALQLEVECLKAEKQKAQDECLRLTQECQELTKSLETAGLEHTSALKEREAIIDELQDDGKELESLIEESYEERENLQEALTKSAKKMQALDAKVKTMAAEIHLLKERDHLLSAELAESQMKEQALLHQLEILSVQQQPRQPIFEEMPDVEEQEQQIEILQSLVTNLEATIAATKHDRDEAVSFYKEEMERYYLEIQEEQAQQIENAKEDEEILMAIEKKFMDGEEHKELMSALLEEQEKEILCLQSTLADATQSEEFSSRAVMIVEKEDKEEQKKIMQELHKSRQNIMQLHTIIGDLQEDAEEGEGKVVTFLDQEDMYKEEIAQLQEENYELNWALKNIEGEAGGSPQQQDLQQYEEIILALKEQVELLTEDLEEEQEKRLELEEHLTMNDMPKDQGEVVISALAALKEEVVFLSEELEMEQQERYQAESQLQELKHELEAQEKPSRTPRGEVSQADHISQEAPGMEFGTVVNSEESKEFGGGMQEGLSEAVDCCPGCNTDLYNDHMDGGRQPVESSDWTTEVSLLRSEISRLKTALQSKQPQDESSLGLVNTSGSQESYIFQDEERSEDDDEKPNAGLATDFDAAEKELEEQWGQEIIALRHELGELTVALRESHHHASEKPDTIICQVCQSECSNQGLSSRHDNSSALPSGTSTDDSSVASGFEQEILLLRQEVHRQHQERKLKNVSGHSSIIPKSSSASLVSSLESSFSSSTLPNEI